MTKSLSDKHIITYESRAGDTWNAQTLSLPSRIRVGEVLKEMRSQDVIRNVVLVQSATA